MIIKGPSAADTTDLSQQAEANERDDAAADQEVHQHASQGGSLVPIGDLSGKPGGRRQPIQVGMGEMRARAAQGRPRARRAIPRICRLGQD